MHMTLLLTDCLHDYCSRIALLLTRHYCTARMTLLLTHMTLLLAHMTLLLAHMTLLLAHMTLLLAHMTLLLAHMILLLAHMTLLLTHMTLIITYMYSIVWKWTRSVEWGVGACYHTCTRAPSINSHSPLMNMHAHHASVLFFTYPSYLH